MPVLTDNGEEPAFTGTVLRSLCTTQKLRQRAERWNRGFESKLNAYTGAELLTVGIPQLNGDTRTELLKMGIPNLSGETGSQLVRMGIPTEID